MDTKNPNANALLHNLHILKGLAQKLDKAVRANDATITEADVNLAGSLVDVVRSVVHQAVGIVEGR